MNGPAIRVAHAIAILAAALLVAACGGAGSPGPAPAGGAGNAPVTADPALAELRVDYATYSPPSLVLKKMGWGEDAFKGTSVKWVYSAGSSNARYENVVTVLVTGLS